MAKHRILSEQLEYVCAQRNLTLARREYRSIKLKESSTKEQIAKAKARLDVCKAKLETTSATMARAGLSKGSI
jgi:multidrug resistance efflux pump